MESTGWGYLWSSVWACALAWLSIDCHSGVVSWTGYSENCHLRIFSGRFSIEEYFFWIRTPLEFSHFFTCVVLFSLIGRRILFFPSKYPFPSSPSLFPFPSPFPFFPSIINTVIPLHPSFIWISIPSFLGRSMMGVCYLLTSHHSQTDPHFIQNTV